MAQEVINIGVQADDGTGDTIRGAGIKINSNFTELFAMPIAQSSLGIVQNEISTIQSNADIVFKPSGTGAILFPAITINDNNIQGTRSNEDLIINASGTGAIQIGALKFAGTSISSDDSTAININEGLVVDGTINVSGTATTPPRASTAGRRGITAGAWAKKNRGSEKEDCGGSAGLRRAERKHQNSAQSLRPKEPEPQIE